jgi:diguanylate cyclase (GGDEF)-like protein/PAS domain S-box-containing protein
MSNTGLQQEDLFAAILRHVADGIVAIDSKLLVIFMNPAAERRSGWTEGEARGKLVPTVLSLIESNNFSPLIPNALPKDETPMLFRDVILKNHEGGTYIVDGSITGIQSPEKELSGYVLVFRDISEIKKMSAVIDYHSSHDGLTGMNNQDSFIQQLQEALNLLRREGGNHILLELASDQYQTAANKGGIQAGNELIRQTAELIRSHIQRRDIAARIWEDKFALILRNCSIDDAINVAQRLQSAAHDFTFNFEGFTCSLSFSMGIVVLTDAESKARTILNTADKLCGTAKEQGGNRLIILHDHPESLERPSHTQSF